jgi:hypothetical protein
MKRKNFLKRMRKQRSRRQLLAGKRKRLGGIR